MAFKIKDTLQIIQGHLTANGYLTRAQIAEPKNAPTDNVAAAIFMSSSTMGTAYLGNQVEEHHVVTVRFYVDMMHEPSKKIEFRLSEVVAEFTDDLLGDFSLGENVREVDYAGMGGTPLSARYGYSDISGKMYRIVDLSLPLNVDNSVTVTR